MTATPATRLQAIHKRLIVNRADSLTMQKVWAEIFGIPLDTPNTHDWVIEAAMAFRAQVDYTRKQLDKLGVPADLTSAGFIRLKEVANPAVLDHPWTNHKGNVSTPEIRLVLAWSAWVLREFGEPEVEQQHFEAIQQHLSELESMLQDPEIPPAIRSFVQRQVDDTRSALRRYPIEGISALRKALDTTTGAYAVPDDQILDEVKQATPSSKEVLRKSMEVLKETAEAVGHVEKLKTAFDALNGAIPQLKEFGRTVWALLPGAGS